jgi:RNA polymerase sigma-70 factor (ECF subfamily)
MTGQLDFEELVDCHYAALYRFALSLTQNQTEAGDLTQQTFFLWATKGHQLRDPAKVKTWLFTTLHREFLAQRRRQSRFAHEPLDEAMDSLPLLEPELVRRLDAAAVVRLLREVDAVFRAPVALFYLEDHSYKEIAEILQVPLGTVKSRIARGLAQLQTILARSARAGQPQRGHTP